LHPKPISCTDQKQVDEDGSNHFPPYRIDVRQIVHGWQARLDQKVGRFILDACRVLATEGVDPSAPVVMRHKGQDHDAPQSTIGKAASLTVTTIRGKTVFAKWRVRAWEHLSRAVRLPSQGLRCMMTATLRASATLALFIPLRLTSFIAQLFNAVQPLSGLVSVMLAAVENRAHPCITESKCHYRGECSLLPSVSPPCLGRPE
jgi:hypothetical protein